MRLLRLFLAAFALLTVTPAALAESGVAEEMPRPSVVALEQELAAVKAHLADLQADFDRLQQRLGELESSTAAQQPPAAEDDLAALRAAAEREAVGEEAAPEGMEEVTFTSGALGLQALNPEISVTGDFISSYRSGADIAQPLDNTFRTLALHFESYLDPYSKFKAAVPVTDDNASIGEAYFTRYGWRKDLNVTLGKFRQQLGVVNRWHKHGLDQVDFPLPLRQIFGPGGLNQTGASLEWQMPQWRGAAQELTLQVTNGENGRVFRENSRNMPAVLAHYKNYRDLDKDTYLELGLTGLTGRNDTWNVLSQEEVFPQRRDLWTTVLGADLTLLWEPTEAMRYENWVWRTEAYLLNKDILAPDGSGDDTIRSWGAYSYFQKKLNRTLDAGLRLDYYQPDVKPYASLPGLSLAPLAVTESGAHQWLFAPYVTWYQSPWVHWRLEWDHQNNHKMGPDEDALYLQCIFAAGPHKHERY